MGILKYIFTISFCMGHPVMFIYDFILSTKEGTEANKEKYLQLIKEVSSKEISEVFRYIIDVHQSRSIGWVPIAEPGFILESFGVKVGDVEVYVRTFEPTTLFIQSLRTVRRVENFTKTPLEEIISEIDDKQYHERYYYHSQKKFDWEHMTKYDVVKLLVAQGKPLPPWRDKQMLMLELGDVLGSTYLRDEFREAFSIKTEIFPDSYPLNYTPRFLTIWEMGPSKYRLDGTILPSNRLMTDDMELLAQFIDAGFFPKSLFKGDTDMSVFVSLYYINPHCGRNVFKTILGSFCLDRFAFSTLCVDVEKGKQDGPYRPFTSFRNPWVLVKTEAKDVLVALCRSENSPLPLYVSGYTDMLYKGTNHLKLSEDRWLHLEAKKSGRIITIPPVPIDKYIYVLQYNGQTLYGVPVMRMPPEKGYYSSTFTETRYCGTFYYIEEDSNLFLTFKSKDSIISFKNKMTAAAEALGYSSETKLRESKEEDFKNLGDPLLSNLQKGVRKSLGFYAEMAPPFWDQKKDWKVNVCLNPMDPTNHFTMKLCPHVANRLILIDPFSGEVVEHLDRHEVYEGSYEYALEDKMDIPLCEVYGKLKGKEGVIFTKMAGKFQYVPEILDTRYDTKDRHRYDDLYLYVPRDGMPSEITFGTP